MDIMQTAEIVEKILLIVVGILIVVDIYLYLNKTEGDTISNILKGWVNDRFFFITYLWGVLAGHFFLGTRQPFINSTVWSVIIVLLIALLLFVLGMIFKKRVPPKGQILLLVLGVAVGHFFWSLN